jgi:divalent metal cation (Fe/Co/Zn/Cd) transporter
MTIFKAGAGREKALRARRASSKLGPLRIVALGNMQHGPSRHGSTLYPRHMSDAGAGRLLVVARGKRLEYFTIGWNLMEGIAAVVAGALAGSISLTAFGIDSFIEVTSGAALLWRMSLDANQQRRERNERIALRLVGACFLALAAYVAIESIHELVAHQAPEHSVFGIVIACVSLIVMPLLSKAKKRVGTELDSAAMRADAKQTDFCVYLSAILLVGLVLNALFGWWWADPVAGLVMVPFIGNEGYRGLRAEACGCH